MNAPTLRIDEFANSIKGVELVAGDDGHGVSVRGGSIRETDVRIDGISVRDPRSENAYLSFNSTSIEELLVSWPRDPTVETRHRPSVGTFFGLGAER